MSSEKNPEWCFWVCNSKKAIFLVAAILIIYIILITLAVVFFFNTSKGAVAANGKGCAQIGGRMLNDGGSAVDAAIATLLCEGIMLPQAMGIGGGFVGILYTQSTGKIETLIAREWAPAAAVQDMFVGKNVTGALASGVPGELLGSWEMHQKYGKLPWKQLFQPIIKLCKEGHWVSDFLEDSIKLEEDRIRDEPSLKEIFVKEDGTLYKEGDYIKRPQLAKTLEIIAEKGIGEMYGGGEIAQKLVEDITEMGGIITVDDLQNFKVSWEDENHMATKVKGDYTLYSTPLPTSGVVLAFMINVMNELHTKDMRVYWHRVIETFKHAYGRRSSLGDVKNEPDFQEAITNTTNQLQDPNFIKLIRSLIHDDKTSEDINYYGAKFTSDQGTGNIAVLASNGDAVSITSTVNTLFGAKKRSKSTGIILNDQMDDFSTPGVVNAYGIPASPTNYIRPGKRPMSSMCPSIVLNKNNEVHLVLGGAGGTKITTSVATTILRYLFLSYDIARAVDEHRVHHQLVPMEITVDPNVPIDIQNYLKSVGHKLNVLSKRDHFVAVTAIGFSGKLPVPHYDEARTGSRFPSK